MLRTLHGTVAGVSAAAVAVDILAAGSLAAVSSTLVICCILKKCLCKDLDLEGKLLKLGFSA